MRKKIAFFCGQVQRDDYYPELIDELSMEARKIDADLFVMINYGIFDHNIILYAEGEKSIMRIPELGSFDAILVDESMFHIEGMKDELRMMMDRARTEKEREALRKAMDSM